MRRLWARSMIHAGDKRAVQEEKESPVICNRKNTSFFLLRKKKSNFKKYLFFKKIFKERKFRRKYVKI